MSTTGVHVRNRHTQGIGAAGVFSRDTHNSGGFDPIPTDPYYGSVIDYEMIGLPEVPIDALPPAEPFDPATLPPGWLPPTAFDPTPPLGVASLSMSSDVVADADGHSIMRLVFEIAQPGGQHADLYGTWVEYTNRYTYNAGGEITGPVWDSPSKIFLPSTATKATVEGVAGLALYYARAYTVDVQANRSVVSSVVSFTTSKDMSAPAIPQGLDLVSGYRGFGASWDASAAGDLMFNEIRYAPDIGTGLAPDTASWVTVRARTNAIFIGSLVGEALYWCQVRAVDLSGNVETSSVSSVAVDYLAYPEAGWSVLASVMTSKIGSEDIGAGQITANHIDVGALSADVIGAGTLTIRPTVGYADGIEVLNAAGVVIGRWDENGIKITDPTDPLRYMLLAAGELVFRNTVTGQESAITPEGINASQINFGSLSGGHNLVLNSSFELANFAAAPAVDTFTDATKWASGNRVTAPDNVTEGAALTVLAPGFA